MNDDELTYGQIPTFKCVEGCTDCCGPVPGSLAEIMRIPEGTPRGHGACPFIADGACGVYEIRPLMCRLFGTVDTPSLTCPHGRRPEILIPDARARKLVQHYSQDFGGMFE